MPKIDSDFDIKTFLFYMKKRYSNWTTIKDIENEFNTDKVTANRRLTRCLPFLEFGDMVFVEDRKYKTFRIKKCFMISFK
jgi:hypothetical protein